MNRRDLLSLIGAQWLVGRGWSAEQSATWVKSALVIGNAKYQGAQLPNAVNDARLIAAAAKDVGFQVGLSVDAGLQSMLDSIKTWLQKSATADVRLLYFSGHGAQFRGKNYLIPVDAELRSEDDLPSKAINLSDLTDRLARFESGVNIVVLDACRSVPWVSGKAARMRGATAVPPKAGLSPVLAPKGTIIAYSTSPGAVAADGAGQNSPYTQQLAANMKVPGLPVEALFKRVRTAVMQQSNGVQVPWETSSLVGEFCMAANTANECLQNEQSGPTKAGRALDLRRF